jgi:penicillin-binding protein 1C
MRFIKLFAFFLIIVILIILFLNFAFPLNIDRLHKPKSTLIYDNNNQIIALKLSSDGFLRIPLEASELNEKIKKTVLSYEDQYFYYHMGVNPLSIFRAIWFNLNNQHNIGASTITMQVARMMHHKPRTSSQKIIEIFQALQLEWYYSKEEILTFYLNNAPYGGNVEGFASAAYKYFQLKPSALSLAQVAYLSSIPKNPNSNHPYAKNININYIKNRLLKRIQKTEEFDQDSLEQALEERVVVNSQNLPNRVPHITAQVKQEGKVYTTIELPLQKQVEKLLLKGVIRFNRFNIHNASAIVINNKTMDIIAYVPSHNFYDNKHGGQNNGLTSLLSPGSTLKPFIYARALEKGLITPNKKLFDVPLFIDGYKPTNYSKSYLGEVTATEALQLSLNIPAIELDRLLKDESLYDLLKQAKIQSINKKKSYYGSSLSLGGFGLALQNNAELFAMLANEGIYEKASFLKERKKMDKQQLLTKESSYLVSTMLADAPRSAFSATWGNMQSMQRIAFKTGTSAHAKDMLTIGYTPEYTVAVWYGNFSGETSKALNGISPTGLRVASPTMFEIFSLLGQQRWFIKPKNIVKQEVCQDAIQLGECQEEIIDDVIAIVNLKQECQVLRAEVLSYLQKQGELKSIKSLNSHPCYETWTNYKPLITSPTNDEHYVYNQYLPNQMKKTKLECFSFQEKSQVYWLIDAEEPMLGKSGEALFLYLSPGKHTISCLDEGAKLRSINIVIEEG